MSKVWIREYQSVATQTRGTAAGNIPIPLEGQGLFTDQTPLDISGVAVQSAAFAASTTFIGIYGDIDFHYVVGTGTPIPTTNSFPVAARTEKIIGVKPTEKVGCIKDV